VPIKATVKNIVFELEACRWAQAVVTCTFFVRNDLSERRLTIGAGAAPEASRAYADGGREYAAFRVRLGSAETGSFGMLPESLPTGVAVRGVISFKNVPADVAQFTSIDLGCTERYPGGPFRVELRNVPIIR
jgi:hypothetical protein